tara:strand:+ start:6170 stop:7345 length:1176 start_codon:yes stop_codon:yes gene_type:complete
MAITYGSATFADINANDHTFSGMSVGTADADRWVIAAFRVAFNTGNEWATVTIGGISATRMYGAPTLTSGGLRHEYWKANVPTGTTADVAATLSGTLQVYNATCATYSMVGEPTLSDSDIDLSPTGTLFETTVDVSAGGDLIAVGGTDFTGVLTSWTGATANSTDDTNHRWIASASDLSAETGRSVDLTIDNTWNIDDILTTVVFDVDAGTSTVTGSGAVTFGGFDVAGNTPAGHTASGDIGMPALTAAGAGQREVVSTGDVTFAAAAVLGSTTRVVTGSGGFTLPIAGLVGTGLRDVTSTGDVGLPAPTFAGSGVREVAGAGGIELSAVLLAATVSRTVNGSGAIGLPTQQIYGLGEGVLDIGPSYGQRRLTGRGRGRLLVDKGSDLREQ